MADINITARLDLTELRAEEQTALEIVRGLNREIEQTRRSLWSVGRSTLTALGGTVSAWRQVLQAMGVAIPETVAAVFSAVTTTIYALQAIATAYAAGGVTMYLTALVEGAAIVLSVVGIGAAIHGQQEVQSSLGQAEAAMRSVGSTMNLWQRVFSGNW